MRRRLRILSPAALRELLRWRRVQRYLVNPWRRTRLAIERRHHPGPRILANALPKSGTYLLDQCLGLLPGCTPYHRGVFVYGPSRRRGLARRRSALARMGGGCYAQAHLPHSAEAADIVAALGLRHVLIIRDPRDVALSYVRFQMARADLPYHRSMHELPDDETRINTVLLGTLGGRRGQSAAEQFRRYLQWRDEDCLLVRFEDLVGPRGGGDQGRQVDCVSGIATHLDLELDVGAATRVAGGVFNPSSRTFRRGAIGEWRETYSETNRRLADELLGEVIDELGYS